MTKMLLSCVPKALFIIVFLQFSFADECSSASPPTKKPEAILNSPLAPPQDILTRSQQVASEALLRSATWVDSFFDDDLVREEHNRTRGAIKFHFSYRENDGFNFKPRLSLRLKLPQLSKRLNLVLFATDDDDFDFINDEESLNSTENDADREQSQISLQYFAKQSSTVNLSYSLGGSYDYLYTGLRFRYAIWAGLWQNRFTNRLRYYTDDGLENRFSYELEKNIDESWFFRAVTTLLWAEDSRGIPHSQLLRLYNTRDERTILLYELGVYLESEPQYSVSDVEAVVRFRKRVWQDWFVVELAPQVNFPEDNDRETELGIQLKLEFFFGHPQPR